MVKKIEKFRIKRCLEEGEGSYGSYKTFRYWSHAFFKDLLGNDMEACGISLIPYSSLTVGEVMKAVVCSADLHLL